MLWRNADFSCHAARRGAPTTARGRVRCAVAISISEWKVGMMRRISPTHINTKTYPKIAQKPETAK